MDPCSDSDEVISDILHYEDGELTAKGGNQKGLDTIRKFKLNSELLSWLRSKQLHLFKNTLIEILQKKTKRTVQLMRKKKYYYCVFHSQTNLIRLCLDKCWRSIKFLILKKVKVEDIFHESVI